MPTKKKNAPYIEYKRDVSIILVHSDPYKYFLLRQRILRIQKCGNHLKLHLLLPPVSLMELFLKELWPESQPLPAESQSFSNPPPQGGNMRGQSPL